jgi:elongation factor P
LDIAEVSRNTKFLINGVPFAVEDVKFVKPGKGRAMYYLKLRNLFDGTTRDQTYHSSDKVEEVHVSSNEMQYLYKEGDHYVFMDNENFEQHHVPKELLGTRSQFLKEGLVVTVSVMEGKVLEITLPKFVELVVVKGAASSKSDTITAQSKMVELETGVALAVPAFVKEGDVLKVDTRTSSYVERVTTKR